MELKEHIKDACAKAEAISVIYTKLRGTVDTSTRTSLLKSAETYADTLNIRIQTITSLAGGNLPDAESVAAMHELGALMERLMIQEREYRISAGGETCQPV